jgi:prepilin-type processing-associated H-X9-DG protein
VYVCPSSELGSLSPDNPENTTNPNARYQAALHYRANGGSGRAFIQGTWGRHQWWTDTGVIYPASSVRMEGIADGTSNTILASETSSAIGRALSNGWHGIQPWTWGYYNYEPASTPPNPNAGWLMIDHKAVTHPIGYTGSFFANETPFTSNHGGGGVNIAFCDGSVRFLTKETPLATLQALATRAGGEVVALP